MLRAPAPLGRRLLLGVARRASTSASTVDVAGPADLKNAKEHGNVLLVERKLAWQPLKLKAPPLHVETSGLFCASNDPLAHTADDIGKYFQFDGSTRAFADLFYHTGFCGEAVRAHAEKLKTAAMMVRAPALALRDELLAMQTEGRLADAGGIIVSGDAGCGKSSTLNYVAAAANEVRPPCGRRVAATRPTAVAAAAAGGRARRAPNLIPTSSRCQPDPNLIPT